MSLSPKRWTVSSNLAVILHYDRHSVLTCLEWKAREDFRVWARVVDKLCQKTVRVFWKKIVDPLAILIGVVIGEQGETHWYLSRYLQSKHMHSRPQGWTHWYLSFDDCKVSIWIDYLALRCLPFLHFVRNAVQRLSVLHRGNTSEWQTYVGWLAKLKFEVDAEKSCAFSFELWCPVIRGLPGSVESAISHLTLSRLKT